MLALSADQDYRRLLAAQALQPLLSGAAGAVAAAVVPPTAAYFFPLGPAAAHALERQWERVTGGGGGGAPAELDVMFGRKLHVVSCAGWARVATS